MSIHRRVTWEDEQDEQQPVSSPFRRALAEYQRTRKKGAKLPQFLEDLEKADDAWTKTDVQNAIMKLERDNAGKKSVKVVRTILKPVIRVLTDYTTIVDSLAQADPMPTSVIWGCLRVAINASSRFLELYEKIPQQLESLQIHLANLTEYEELFSESSNMQALLEKSYINVVRFWYRVDKECKRCILNRAARAFSSFSTSKIDTIVEDIERDAHQISLFVPIVQERLNRGERENAAEERRLAGVAREQQSQMLELFLEERKGNRLKDIRQWLQCGPSPLNESNERHRQENRDRRSPETCVWLPFHEVFEQWVEGSSHGKLWLRAAPGVGKSVLCSFAVDHVSTLKPDCACIYQFYSFDEEFTPLQVYRNLGAQLIDQLWSQIQDVPEEIYNFIQQSTSCSSFDNAKNVVRMIAEKFPSTYVFLDGLDEECENDARLKGLLEVIDFLSELPTVHLWCSSQNRARLRARLEEGFALIEVDQKANNEDIRLCLSRRIAELGELELDEGYKTLILDDLLTKADGCFLWVSWMLDSIADAQTLSHVQQEIQGALPGGYEDYYRRKIDSIKPSDRKLACLLLSCIVYARRPLRLEELCEATAAAEAKDASPIDHTQKLFQSKILKICEPLVQVQTIGGAQILSSICTLTHASIRRFLLKCPDVLALNDSAVEYSISEEIMANVCLKYLWQASYGKLLSRKGEAYCDSKGTDILKQQLLPYAAKYWDKHLDALPGHRGWETCEDPKSLCNRVTRFIESSQYITCIQTQSLFVGGQFQFWLSTGHEYLGPHIKRVFPFWLASQCHPNLAQDYAFFLGEWGELLDRITSSTGIYPGEVDRCFWAALGPRHFLRHGTSRYETFILSKSFQAADNVSRRFYDSINEIGDTMVVLKLENLREGDSELRFECQTWSLNSREPQCTQSQMLKLSDPGWHLYEYPLRDRLLGRAIPVDLTRDLEYMRIGCKLLQRSSEGIYQVLDLNKSDRYIDDIASRGRYVAVAQRNSVAEKDMYAPSDAETPTANHDYAEFLAEKLEAYVKSKASSANSSNSTAQSDQSSQPAPSFQTSVSTPEKEEPAKTTNEEVTEDMESEEAFDLDVEDELADSGDEADSEDLALEDSSESEVNSAEMSWSEGSTQAASEIDDEDDWNDWASRDGGLEDLSDSETPTEASSELEIESNSNDTPPSDEGIDFGGGKFTLKYRDQLPESDSDADSAVSSAVSSESNEVEDHYSNSYFSGSGSDDESGSENGQGGRLEDLILGSNKPTSGTTHSISIQVYDTQIKSKKSAPIFHFTNSKASSLFASPPAFHPSKPLLVWPIGNNEILFADISSNSYFTRLISTTSFQSCQVFVKAHFSPDGKYLHFAALEASHGATEEDIKSGRAKVLLNLQVTTHRLSERKTTRSPPRLVFRTNVILGKTNRIDVSNLPFSLTWRSKHLFLTQRSKKLNTIRIPLFAPAPDAASIPVCFTQQPLYLPRTALYRNVHFIPPLTEEEEGVKSDGGARSDRGAKSDGIKSKKANQAKATVIIGSHSSMPAQNFIVPKTQVSPPVMARVDIERDLGGWQCKPNTDFDAGAEANKAAGRLQSRFEAFDLKEDCDIVPFLF